MKSFGVTIQMKPLHAVVFSHGTIYLECSSNFETANEFLWCNNSNETSSAGLSHGTIHYSAFNK